MSGLLRVLYILRYFPTLTETFVYREMDALRAHGIEVAIASLGSRSDGLLQDELPRTPVHVVPRHPLVGRFSRSTAGMTWLGDHQRPKDVARLPWLARLARGFDRIHVHFAGEAAEMAHAIHLDTGLPYTVMVHANDLFKPRPSLGQVLAAAETVLTVADHHVRKLAEVGVHAKRLRCGPDLEAWRLGAMPGDPLRALAVGRNVPKKGLDLLIGSWARCQTNLPPGSRLVCVSDLDPRQVVEGRAIGEIPGLELPGLLPPTALRRRMAGANLCVLPCRQAEDGDMDGVPVVLMEAMAAGRPVLTTPVAGIPELVDEQVGWLVPPDDPAALERTLMEAARDDGERERRGSEGPGRLRDRNFTLQDQANGLISAWRSP